MQYQPARRHDYGINAYPGCFEKQRETDRLKEEIQQLRMKLSVQKRKDREGFRLFDSLSKSSSQSECDRRAKAEASRQLRSS